MSTVCLVVFDFDGVFTNNIVSVTQEGIESVNCWRGDGIGLSRMREVGVRTLILSTEVNPVVTVRANKLQVVCKQGIQDKSLAIQEFCKVQGFDSAKVAFLGNDINDIPAFKAVGVPIAVADAYPEVFPHVLCRTTRPGGYGAVRELCDSIFQAKQEKLAGAQKHGF